MIKEYLVYRVQFRVSVTPPMMGFPPTSIHPRLVLRIDVVRQREMGDWDQYMKIRLNLSVSNLRESPFTKNKSTLLRLIKEYRSLIKEVKGTKNQLQCKKNLIGFGDWFWSHSSD